MQSWLGRVAAGLALVMGTGAQAADFTVCADPDPPPWTTWLRDAQGQPTERFGGFSVELVGAAFARLGKSVEFIGHMPWSRCLRQVETGAVDFAMDGYHSPERAEKFAFSTHYNTLTPQIFYLARQPIQATTRAELQRYRGCGMLGASYAHYGLGPENLDLGVSTYAGMIAKLQARRCEYFVEELEVIAGVRALGRVAIEPGLLANADVTDAAVPAKHLLTAKGGRGATVLPQLDEALRALIRSGEAKRMWTRWAPSGLEYKP